MTSQTAPFRAKSQILHPRGLRHFTHNDLAHEQKVLRLGCVSKANECSTVLQTKSFVTDDVPTSIQTSSTVVDVAMPAREEKFCPGRRRRSSPSALCMGGCSGVVRPVAEFARHEIRRRRSSRNVRRVSRQFEVQAGRGWRGEPSPRDDSRLHGHGGRTTALAWAHQQEPRMIAA